MKLSIIALALLVTGCTIDRNVRPISAGTQLSPLCIEENPKVLMEGFLPELREQIESKGVSTKVYPAQSRIPDDCSAIADYTANWRWDFVMWLTYASITVYANNKQIIGQAEYDARDGNARPDKFGPTRNKLMSVLDPLLLNVAAENK
jgi:hypothetical protein